MILAIWGFSIFLFAVVFVLFLRKICSSSPSRWSIEGEIEHLRKLGYIELKWEHPRFLIKSFRRSGNVLYVMDGNPKKFIKIIFAEEDILEVTEHEIFNPNDPTLERGTPTEGDGIFR